MYVRFLRAVLTVVPEGTEIFVTPSSSATVIEEVRWVELGSVSRNYVRVELFASNLPYLAHVRPRGTSDVPGLRPVRFDVDTAGTQAANRPAEGCLKSVTRRREWSPESPVFDPRLAATFPLGKLDYQPRIATLDEDEDE